jgi:hypothetical protein
MDALKHVPLERLKKLEERFISNIMKIKLGPSNNSNIISQTDTFANNEIYQKDNENKLSDSLKQSLNKARENPSNNYSAQNVRTPLNIGSKS